MEQVKKMNMPILDKESSKFDITGVFSLQKANNAESISMYDDHYILSFNVASLTSYSLWATSKLNIWLCIIRFRTAVIYFKSFPIVTPGIYIWHLATPVCIIRLSNSTSKSHSQGISSLKDSKSYYKMPWNLYAVIILRHLSIRDIRILIFWI